MGHPYRQRHTDLEKTTSDKLAGVQAKQQAKKSASTAKQSKRK